MAFSYVERSGNGTQKAFTFSFEGQDEGYIREEDLQVLVDGAPASFTLTSSNTLTLTIAPPSGDGNILIRRVMPKDVPYADFKRGNNFGQEVLNNSFLQLLYLLHELLDGFLPEDYSFKDAVEFLESVTFKKNVFIEGYARVENSDGSDEKAVVNFEEGDKRYKDPLNSAIEDYQAADANIQSQLTGNVPLEASAFSPVSWHKQEIDNSLTIPDNKNAWSFGPEVSIASGQTVTIGSNSFWTIS